MGVLSASCPGRALLPVPIGQEAWWAPEPVWTQRLAEKSFWLCQGSNLNRPVVQSISDTILTELNQLLQYGSIVTCYCCISTLSRNNAILSDATIMDGLSFHCHATMYQAVIDFHSNEFRCLRTPIGLKLVSVSGSREKHVS
jgi:hypothetical protein